MEMKMRGGCEEKGKEMRRRGGKGGCEERRKGRRMRRMGSEG